MPRVVAIIQARMGSTRLPGKVLLPAAGQPLVLHMLERISRAKRVDALWLATSTLAKDDILAATVEKAGHRVFRGDEQDVLGRYHQLATSVDADIIVRLTGDCPLHDPEVVDHVVGKFLSLAPPAPYMSNALERTYPVGLDTEVFTRAALDEAAANADTDHEREHVCPYFYRPGSTVAHDKLDSDFSHLRWTLDTQADYQLIRTIFERLYPNKPAFSWHDVLALVTREPELLRVNVT